MGQIGVPAVARDHSRACGAPDGLRVGRRTEKPLDLRRTPVSMGSVVTGYGLTPASARQRAVVVRAVTDDSRIRQRPTADCHRAGVYSP